MSKSRATMIERVLHATTILFVTVGYSTVCFSEEVREIMLWPMGMPGPVVPETLPEKVEQGTDGIARRYDVSKPRLLVYRPKDTSDKSLQHSGGRAAVIVVPGGGFGLLADGHEGEDACRWLSELGVIGFQLVHRTPTSKHPEPSEGPVLDAQKAVSVVRSRSKELGVDPSKIGVLGFSAGGQVALIAATNEQRFKEHTAASHKPDFLMLLYPWKIFDPETGALRSDVHLDAGLPPTFIAQMSDDTASLPQGSAMLYLELVKRKLPSEIHIYERGGHGFGMQTRFGATGPSDWPKRAADWLALRELVTVP